MIASASSNKKQRVWIDSEQYKAILRTRYRKFLRKKGVPKEMVFGLRTLEELKWASMWTINSVKK